MELGERGDDGRRIPVSIKNSNYVLKADMVIPAVGEILDFSFSERNEFEIESNNIIKVDPHSLMTSIPGVFAGGDAVRGPSTAIEAIADGKRAAVAMDRYLKGQSLMFKAEVPTVIGVESLDLRSAKKRRRQKVPCLSSKERKKNFNEIDRGFTEEAAVMEADRCLQCGMFPKKNALQKEEE
jgi:formate dehydrogenase major subunit